MSLSKNMGTWDPMLSKRSPVVGDTQVQYDPSVDEYRTAIYDGHQWKEITNHNKISTMNSNISASNITTISGSSSRPTISATERELIFDFLKENMRVAEYTDASGKVITVQLEMRAGEGYVWESIRRVKTKDPL